jgi:hypothetical protein
MESAADLLRVIPVLKSGYRAILIVVRFQDHKGCCTFLRVDTDENWAKIIQGLENFQPAEWFNLRHLGIDIDRNIKHFQKYLTILDARKRIHKWIFSEKCYDDAGFREFNRSIDNYAEEIFDGKDLWDAEIGKWHQTFHVNATKHRSKRVIF